MGFVAQTTSGYLTGWVGTTVWRWPPGQDVTGKGCGQIVDGRKLLAFQELTRWGGQPGIGWGCLAQQVHGVLPMARL